VITSHRGEFTVYTFPAILNELRKKLEAESARIEITFPYFLERIAPVSRASAMMDFECTFIAEANQTGDDFVMGVRVPVTTLCPCSREISDYGAHNQRGYVSIEVRAKPQSDGQPSLIWIEELIDLAERSASAPIYPLLKRTDERYVTMQAYDNPVFVEDLTRNVVVELRADSRVAWYRVKVLNQESIHNHNAYAIVEGGATTKAITAR